MAVNSKKDGMIIESGSFALQAMLALLPFWIVVFSKNKPKETPLITVLSLVSWTTPVTWIVLMVLSIRCAARKG